MTKRRGAKTAMVVSVFCAAALGLGCGGATKAPPQKTSIAKGSEAPFGGAGDLSELKAVEESIDAEASFDPEDLRVPGSQWGVKKTASGKKKCPKGKKGKKCRENQQESGFIPYSDAIAEQMEGIPWGMHYKAILATFEKKIRENYAEELKSAGGAVEEDRIRTKMIREIAKLKQSYVKFDGQRTGYEGDMVEAEFTHNNRESMLRWDAGKFVEYMFFFDGRFWKRIRSFRKDSFKDDITFDVYVSTLANRFGDGREIVNDVGALIEIKWKDKTSYMAAQDRSGFYGVYCLVFTARVTEDNLAKLRTNKGAKDKEAEKSVSSMITSATSGDLRDNDVSVIDNYTGQEGGEESIRVDTSHSVMRDQPKGKASPKGAKKDGSDKKDKDGDSEDVADIF